MKRVILSLALIAAAIPLFGCRTVDTAQTDRPWYHMTLNHDAVPWPLPVGDLEMIDYHDAHGAGWWDAPWVFAEQSLLLPSYVSWGIGETFYTELLGGGYTYDSQQWQWRAVNWTWGPLHAVLSSVNFAIVWTLDTVGHDPVAAVIWAVRDE